MPGNAPAGPKRPRACFPGSEFSLGEILEHGLLQLGLCQKLPLLRRSPWPEPRVLLLQQSQPRGFLSLHPTELLPPAVVGWLRLFDDLAGLIDGLALDDQRLGRFERADDLFCHVPGAFHGRVPSSGWPDKNSHAPWTDR